MNFWILQDKPNKRIAIHPLNAEPATGGKPLFPREDRGTDRIPTTDEAFGKAKEMSPRKGAQINCRFCHPQYSLRQWDGHPRPVSEKLSRHRLLLRPQRLSHRLRGWGYAAPKVGGHQVLNPCALM